jgi:tol-pal system protein YbgF
MYKLALAVSCLTLASVAYAEVPVEDAVQYDRTTTLVANKPILTQEQRLSQLEQQVNNLLQMGVVSQVKQLQQQVQELRGQLEIQAHDIKTLQDQLHAQYQDLDQRMTSGNKPVAVAKPASTTSTPATATTATAPTKPMPVVATSNETDSYQAAYDFIKARDYAKAEPALQKYLNQYPQGAFSANAHYWLGEIYLSQGKAEQASQRFSTVIQQYPNYGKMAEAKLKLGFAYYDMGQIAQAKQQLQKVQQEYPNSPAARLATTRLQTIQ